MPLVRRTRATFRRAEFGFFGVTVYTRTQTPRFWGDPAMAGAFDRLRTASRPWRTSWLMVGIQVPRGYCRGDGKPCAKLTIYSSHGSFRHPPGGQTSPSLLILPFPRWSRERPDPIYPTTA